SLDIYFLDMVGGGSTLIVTPMGESVLIDTGSLEPKHRDADRMHKACMDAGLQQIDYLVTTHFDTDHYGGILELSKRIPIKCFIDNDTPPGDITKRQRYKQLNPLYEEATKGKTKLLRAGEDIPLKNVTRGKKGAVRLHCVASQKKIEGFDGDIDAPVEGFKMARPDNSNNAGSIALVLSYGRFRFFAGGDITLNIENHLAHPVNRIGKVDLYQVTHHGLDISNNPILLKVLEPTVCVAMNGPRKGIQPRTFGVLKGMPAVKEIYQIHYNTQYGDAGNTPAEFIANPKDNPDQGQYIKARVYADKGVFTVSIGPDGTPKTYQIQ
ncbi:MAG: MBL fold metallo-hydrolase, partial [Phycisphaerae bacterium]|nr:MBL fold metallo-hydrolase [Phycisphaerae bacterium]NIS51097.1 MBL fold metallo-hydrolase [Phycisphaerae bacterium]NIU08730.1 MBL fold metallo-hydrolase [Phycisphaerae bacterium]NIU56358.1 MBL fold metallo-hydrolase [Phycisphaerae bacterium]NIV01574.1 MBL fold metallo-hydrolase [Phycisphaerae bacterium]